jgi:hypothetical protein
MVLFNRTFTTTLLTLTSLKATLQPIEPLYEGEIII